jgi:hypothetical protein
MYKVKSLIIILFLVVGCSPVPVVDDPKSIQQVYADRLSKVRIGMPISEFQSIFPEAYPGGQNGNITAYELKHTQKYRLRSDLDNRPVDSALGLYRGPVHTSNQLLWFYFYDSALVKWGRPQDQCC